MKNLTLITSIIFCILTQKAISQDKKAALFSFMYQIDQKLTEETSYKNDNKNFFTTFSSSEPMPEILVDSMLATTEQKLSKKLGYPVKVTFYKNKKGKEIKTLPVNGQIGGLPGTSFKKIKSQHSDYNYYIKIMANLYSSGGMKFDFGFEKFSYMKPKLTLKLVVYDNNKKQVLKKTINLKDLHTVRSHEKDIYNIFDRHYKYTETKGLSPFDLYTIYLMGLDKLISEL